MKIPSWLQVALALLAISGAAWGLLLLTVSPTTGRPRPTIEYVALGLFAAIYALGAWAGVATLQKRYGWLHLTRVFWWLQVPVVGSPLLSYGVASGLSLSVWLRFNPPGVGTFWGVGSKVDFSFMKMVPFALGVNLVALAISIYLAYIQRKAA